MIEIHGWVNVRNSFDPNNDIDMDNRKITRFLKEKIKEIELDEKYVNINPQNGSLYVCITAFFFDNHTIDKIALFLEYIAHSQPGSYGLMHVSDNVLGEFQIYSMKKGILSEHNELRYIF